jgi:nucleotide-binding universal stress UspA family protein
MMRTLQPARGHGPVGARLVPARLVVLTVVDEIPPWVDDWCRRTGCALSVQHLPAEGPEGGGHGVEHIRSLPGDLVLVLRPGLDGTRPHRVVAAVRDLDAEAAVLRHAAQIAAGSGAEFTVLHAVPWSFGERSVGLDAAVHTGRRLLDEAARRVAADAPAVVCRTRLVRAHPHEAVAGTVPADLLVLGGPRAGRAELGLVICTAVQHAPCPVLLVPRR